MSLEYRNNVNSELNLKNLSVCNKLITQNKYDFLSKGFFGEVLKVHSPDCGSVVVKKFIINEKKMQKYKDYKEYKKAQLEQEYNTMKMVNPLITNFICPNFIQVYGFNSSIPLIIMEYADSDSRFLFKNFSYIETSIYKTFLFQVLVSIYCFQKYTKFNHNDIKLENILCKKINPNTIFHYSIDNVDYYVPTYGYLFMLGDFGLSSKKNTFDLERLNYHTMADYVGTLYKNYPNITLNSDEKYIIDVFIKKDLYVDNKLLLKYKKNLMNKFKSVNKTMNNYIFEINSILTVRTY
jgi:serine/threonine protein kinase